jgi:hypothetical protein
VIEAIDRPARQDNLPRFFSPPHQFPFHLLLEGLLRHVTGFCAAMLHKRSAACPTSLVSLLERPQNARIIPRPPARSIDFRGLGELAPAGGHVFLVSGKNLERACLRKYLKVVPANWRGDVKIRLFLRPNRSHRATTNLKGFLGTN